MSIPVIIVCIIVAVVISVFRAKKIAKEREEERKRAERKRSGQHVSPQTNARPNASAMQGGKNAQDPFPAYRGDPFAEAQGERTGTLSPAQLHEWLIDFRMAEEANMPRPPKRKEPSRFARYLHENGFAYRGLRKMTGHTPQNRLPVSPPAHKKAPAHVSCVVRSDISVPELTESKEEKPSEPKQYFSHVAVPDKEITRTQYEAQYKDAC